MRNSVDSFRGEAPRLTPRALPPNGAQDATNARLLSGDLEAWRQFALEQVLDNTGPVLSIYRLGSIWLAWDADVDVARGALAGDTSLRVFLTGPDAYDRPRWTNLALAGAGNGPPAETRPLGVPSPEGAPSVAAGIDPTPSSFAIDILDEGNVLATSWSTSPPVNQATFNSNVVQDNANGNPAPSYQMSWRDYEVGTYLRRNFGIASANSVSMGFDWLVNTTSGRSRFWAAVQRNEAGEGVSVQLDQVSADSWVLSIGTGSSWQQGQNQNTLISSAAVSTLASDTWMRMFITVVTNLDTTTTVTATVRDISDTDLVSVTTQVATPAGDFCGFGSGFDQLGETSIARFDNIHVQAAGSTGYNPVNTATSYVYTYVNDQSEESAPSFASDTVLRPAGIAITVTTPTDIPTGLDSSWHIDTKRIYRSVVGSTGTIFRFVAEIPLAQLDYVDSIPDTELGDELESEGWTLPPVNLRNILALPNGTMAGIAGNQVCLSAQNRPHAWPLGFRYTVDTDAVAIGNIDTTIVIGTEAFPYLAIGTSPGDYSMTKLEVPQACVSKRSLAYLTGFGVIFASPDGLIAVAGNGNVQNLTSGVFTRKQWQALVPESIVGIAHDDVYHFFYDNDVAACDCSHTAWQANFESPIVGSSPPMLIGAGTFTLGEGLFSISSVTPLYGASSLRVSNAGAGGARLSLTAPAVPIVDAWTASFSVKAPVGGFAAGGQMVLTLKDSGDNGFARVEFRAGAGDTTEFFVFDGTTFSSGTLTGLAYDTVYNCEFSAGGGRMRCFVNGVSFYDNSTNADQPCDHFDWERSGDDSALELWLDELRITNQVEHTADYAVALPFCTCAS